MHKVHRPDLINGLGHRQDLRLIAHQSLSGFDAQVQLKFAIDAVNPFVVPSKIRHVAQVQVKQAKAPVAVVVREAYQQVGNLFILGVELGLVAVTGLTDGKNCGMPAEWSRHAGAPPLWPSRACETAALLFCEVLVGDFRLELLFQIHFFKAPVLVFELFHARHHGGVHAAELGTPLVKGGAADAQLPANLRYWQTSLNPFKKF